ncbi:MAG: type II secretion system F family protein [Armatimonadota bacterium]
MLVIGLAMKGERAIIASRIKSLNLSWAEDIEKVVPELATPFSERVLRTAIRKFTTSLSKLMPTNTSSIAGKLEQAGNPWKLQPLEFMGLKTLSIIIFVAMGLCMAILVDMTPTLKICIVICTTIVGYAIPDTLLEQKIRSRHTSIRKSLPNSLDLLVVSAEAGLGFDAALAGVAERTTGPLAEEFSRVLQDMTIGRSRTEALKAMSVRVGLSELTTFVAAIRQADMLGTSIVGVLRVQAASLRTKRNLHAREVAAKLPVKLLFPLVFCIFPAIFAVVLGPAVIRILKAFAPM